MGIVFSLKSIPCSGCKQEFRTRLALLTALLNLELESVRLLMVCAD